MPRAPQVRVMKARATRAVSCGHWVIRGELIVKVPDGTWICLACRMAEITASRAAAGGEGEAVAGRGTPW